MIDSHLSQNTEEPSCSVWMKHWHGWHFLNHPHAYFDAWDFILLLSECVWGIKLTLYSIQKAIYNLQDLSESLSKKRGGKENIITHGGRLICFSTRICSNWLFQLDSFFSWGSAKGEQVFYLPITLPPVSPNGTRTEDVRRVNRRMKWALGWLSVWISMICLTHRPFHTHRSVPLAPNQT